MRNAFVTNIVLECAVHILGVRIVSMCSRFECACLAGCLFVKSVACVKCAYLDVGCMFSEASSYVYFGNVKCACVV